MIEIINQTEFKANRLKIINLSKKLFKYFSVPSNQILEILFLDEKDIKSLNKSYRSNNKSTDVLSFKSPSIPNLADEQVFGSIVICPGYIHQFYPDENSYASYIIHGFLHLIGFDHENKLDYIEFKRLTKKISTKLKIKNNIFQ